MKYSIIIPYYQGTVTDTEFTRCLKSIQSQTCTDYEVLIYHDGPLIRPFTIEQHKLINDLDAKFECSAVRINDFGHSNRNKGIHDAKGKYIIHVNSDNILYDVLHEINTSHKIIITKIRMNGMHVKNIGNSKVKIYKTEDKNHSLVLKGNPEYGSIDAMQLIMTRRLWLQYGGWYDKRPDGDGYMYERFCKENDFVMQDIIIGEHN